MKIVVLGASGGCGRQLVKQAVERGWEVTAVGRSTSSLELPDGVRIVRGELQDADALEAAFEGADTVFSALGLNLSGLSPFSTAEVPDLLSRAAPVIVEAMKRTGVPRLVAISAGGVGDSAALMPWFYKWIVAMTSMRRLYPELEVMESVYASSELDVCCVRPTTLTDGPRTGRAVVATRLVGQADISRADLASWMLDAAEGGRFEHFGPLLTERGAG
ncbi:MAG: NAD(P)H-binding protein [Proteobacteria bacterium]|nr:NAD(P)H-binding protein [Pseudomonadota bacterium]